MGMDEYYNNKSYRMYYVAGVVILVVLIAYFFAGRFFDTGLTEQICKDTFSQYDPSISNANLNYANGVAQFSSNIATAEFIFSGTRECVMHLSVEKAMKGIPYQCQSGITVYKYAAEHENYYELEITSEEGTLVDLFAKTPELAEKFSAIENSNLCGALP